MNRMKTAPRVNVIIRLTSFICACLSLLSFSSLPSAAARAQEGKAQLVKQEYFEKQDVTQITLNPFILASRKFEELRLGAVTSYPGKVKTKPREVALLFVSLSKADTNKYESARMLTIITNEQRYPLGETKRSKQARDSLFIETMAAVIPMDTFVRICWSKEVSIKLGLTEVKLSPDQISLLRAAASYMTQ